MDEFITLRKAKTNNLNLSFTNMDYTGSSSSLQDTSARSLPNISIGDYLQINELKKEINRLHQELESAHEEVANLIMANNSFKVKLNECEIKLKIYKDICKNELNKSNVSPCQSIMATPICNKKKTDAISSNDLMKRINGSPFISEYKSLRQNKKEDLLEPRHSSNSQTIKELVHNIDNNYKNKLKVSLKRKVQQEYHTPTENIKNYVQQKVTAYKPTQVNSRDKNIFIISDEQLLGLSAALMTSRAESWNDEYKSIGYIKPNARSEVILSQCGHILNKVTTNDIVILCIGNHDYNPKVMTYYLRNTLDKLKNIDVHVISAQHVCHLNQLLLNNSIKLVTQDFKNCNFIDLQESYYVKNKNRYIHQLTKLINLKIDSKAYKTKYLSFGSDSVLKRHLSNKKPFCIPSLGSQSTTFDDPKKGTIPYYFK